MKIVKKGLNAPLCIGLNTSEFDCRCEEVSCTMTIIQEDLLRAYEKFRRAVNCELIIGSGYRCPFRNWASDGDKVSRHMVGHAIDVLYIGDLTNFPATTIMQLAKEAGFIFIKYYKDEKFFHLQSLSMK